MGDACRRLRSSDLTQMTVWSSATAPKSQAPGFKRPRELKFAARESFVILYGYVALSYPISYFGKSARVLPAMRRSSSLPTIESKPAFAPMCTDSTSPLVPSTKSVGKLLAL